MAPCAVLMAAKSAQEAKCKTLNETLNNFSDPSKIVCILIVNL